MNRKYSLKRNRDFRYVYRKGKSYGSRLMVMLVASSREQRPRIGFCVSKKVGNSVVRNRVKRRMKESLHAHLLSLKPRIAVVFVARPNMATASFADISRTISYLLNKGGLLVQHKISAAAQDTRHREKAST